MVAPSTQDHLERSRLDQHLDGLRAAKDAMITSMSDQMLLGAVDGLSTGGADGKAGTTGQIVAALKREVARRGLNVVTLARPRSI